MLAKWRETYVRCREKYGDQDNIVCIYPTKADAQFDANMTHGSCYNGQLWLSKWLYMYHHSWWW